MHYNLGDFPLDKDGFIYLLFKSILTSPVSIRSLHEGDRERKRNDSGGGR